MAMHSIRNDKPEPRTIDYPKLMTTKNGAILLMTSANIGTVVYEGVNNPAYSIGYYSTGWAWNHLTDYDGSIVLSNKK